MPETVTLCLQTMDDSTVDFPSPFRATQNLKAGLVPESNSVPLIPKLLRIEPVEAGAGLHSVTSEIFTFGRDESCDILVADDSASRRHAKIVRKDSKWLIVDLGSTNGTWVNEESVQIQELASGDRIRIGRWTFKFFVEDNIEAHYHESVYQMMTQDELTGAWNKRYLLDLLDRELMRQQRSKEPLGLMMIDFDDFKQINDQFGHLVGDEVLAEFGRRVRVAIRTSDVFSRFGGDEFAIVVIDADREETEIAADRLLDSILDEPFPTAYGPLVCSVSIGFAVSIAKERVSRDALIAVADKKMYEAKKADGGRVVG